MSQPELGRLVARRRMYFDLVADHELVEGRRAKVGYVLNLFGAHPPGGHPLPGDGDSWRIFHDLAQVARCLPAPDDPAFSACIERFNGLLFDAPALHTDEVSLALTLRLRPEAGPPAEELSLRRLRARLRALGLYEGAWRPGGGAQRPADSPPAEGLYSAPPPL